MPEFGEHTPETRWMHRQSIKDRMEIYMRIFMRFTDPETISPGDVPISTTLQSLFDMSFPRAFDLSTSRPNKDEQLCRTSLMKGMMTLTDVKCD